ncbi:mitogen-activated protein kinase kinase kinase YODA [Cryptomeria japonica]|uniref:mitogen-activated protein kinase kinase kinase YODA n=1 Tax=Cryptomeria japonica TaxID=3369 RepID=UPI0025AC8ED3|nr:mitogen-activated protein kinase kinase kinase YODA [Cryptomeria japonica]XP_057857224.1 mitogen-activated protein kinase kinase kinase YODA [Cryptomeria japonica]XP_057857225.1 mitogen-activated protein kinase kinase kinase YODA [Cryptomeria japonica]XP_057857226.1 mitogen-activated protein kinase kinase kinase YODA [Cryptomeria japonica]
MILPWLGKSSGKKSSNGGKKGSKKSIKESSIFEVFHLRRSSKGANSREESDAESALPSTSTSTSVTRCQSFSHAVPLPLPVAAAAVARCDSGISVSASQPQSLRDRSARLATLLPLPSPEQGNNRLETADGAASGSESSTSSLASDDPADRDPLNHNSMIYAGLISKADTKNKKNRKSNEQPKSNASLLSKPQNLPVASKKGFSSNRESLPKQLQIPVNRVLGNATDSSAMSSPSSPMKAFVVEHHSPTGGGAGAPRFYVDSGIFGSGNCSSPGSGQNSGQNSMGGDIIIGQHFWQQQGKGSSERSPVLSPKMRSPGPSSRGQSVAVSPLHPRAGGLGPESPTGKHEDGKQPLCHLLPRPPRSPTTSSPYSPSAKSSGARSPAGKENPTSPATRWKKGKLLGSGTFGHVYVGFNNESGEMCAMKEVTLFSDDSKSKDSVKQLGQEIAMLSHLRHPNIVQYYGSEMVDDTLYIYLEYVSGGSIHQLLREYGQFGEPAIRSYTRQILAGLAYLHDLNTVHRDIKGANILVDPNGQVKLADFGMAKHISAHSCPLSFRGTPHWMAPEVIKNINGYDLAVDIWSLGCTVVEMATAEPPWRQYEGVAAMFKIGNSKELPAIPDHLSEEGKSFVRLCLQRNPTHRPIAAQLLEHPFVKNAAPFVRLDPGTKAMETEALPSSACGIRTLNSTQHPAHSRHPLSVEADHSTSRSRIQSTYQPSSDQFCAQRNISLPVSPSASPSIQSRSPNYRYDTMSPSPISTPTLRSGSSTPLTGGYGAIPLQASGGARQTVYVRENFGNMPQMMNGTYPISFGGYTDSRPDFYAGVQALLTPEGSPRLQSHLVAESDVMGKTYGRVLRNENGHSQRQNSGHGVLAEFELKKLQKNPSQVVGFDLRPVSPMLGRANGHEHCLKVVLHQNLST